MMNKKGQITTSVVSPLHAALLKEKETSLGNGHRERGAATAHLPQLRSNCQAERRSAIIANGAQRWANNVRT